MMWVKGKHVGFTKETLKEFGVIWQFIPRVKEGENILAGQAIAQVQTTSRLQSVLSPVNGRVVFIDEDAIDKPNAISEKTTLFQIEGDHALFSL